MAGSGVYADLLARRFARAARQWGLADPRGGLDCARFAVPDAGASPGAQQLSLL